MEYQPIEVQPFDPMTQAAVAAERRRRLMGSPPPKPRPSAAPKRPTRIEYVHLFDEHVLCWREHLGRERMTHAQYIRVRCREIGVKVEDIMGDSRSQKHVRPRQMLMWEIKQRSPNISLPQIGRVFNGRDHTTVLHGIRRHEKRMADDCTPGS